MANNLTETSARKYNYFVQFHHQSQEIKFSDWISLLTICLAPLIAHLVAGAPKIVYLHSKRPPWHERVVHYNPMSIIWRYFAIFDRRVRARHWDEADMVAGVALFWTPNGWDGSEAMITRCRDAGLKKPPPLVKRIPSKDSLKTVIVTLQGCQALYFLTKHGTAAFGSFTLETIFMPISLIGLLRLPAALWLNLADKYLPPDEEDDTSARSVIIQEPEMVENKAIAHVSIEPLLTTTTKQESHGSTNTPLFHGATSARGLLVRTFYISCLLAFLALDVYIMVPRPYSHYIHAASSTILGYFYAVSLIVGTALMAIYSFRDRASASPTIIPCISSMWYKIYTLGSIAFMLVLLILAGLEIRESPCEPRQADRAGSGKDYAQPRPSQSYQEHMVYSLYEYYYGLTVEPALKRGSWRAKLEERRRRAVRNIEP